MKRRDFVAAGLAAPLLARAQRTDRRYRLGVLLPVDTSGPSHLPVIRERLAALGFAEGRNLEIDVRYARTNPDAAQDLLGRKPDALLAATDDAVRAAQESANRLKIELIVLTGFGGDEVVGRLVAAGAQADCNSANFAIVGDRYAAEVAVRARAQARMPAVFAETETVELGGLMSYSSSLNDELRRAVDLLAKILRGDKPADLPVEQAARFELAINLRTARALGLKVPQSILLRADRVIE